MKKTTKKVKAEKVEKVQKVEAVKVEEFETTARQRRFMHLHGVTQKKIQEDEEVKEAMELLEIPTINQLEGFVTKFVFMHYHGISFKKLDITFEIKDFPASKIDMYQQITIIRDPGGFYSTLENQAASIFRGQIKLNLEEGGEKEVYETPKIILKKMQQTHTDYVADVQRHNEYTFDASIVNISRKKKDTITIRVDKEVLDYFCKQSNFMDQ